MNTPVFVQAEQIARWFDVSPGWLERVIYKKPKQSLRAVDGVSFSVRKGETFALVGESGCGKSTLARLLAGLYPLTKGKIYYDGVDIRSEERRVGKERR